MLVSSMEASLPGPLSGSLHAPHSAGHSFQGHPHPFSDPRGLLAHFLQGPCSA